MMEWVLAIPFIIQAGAIAVDEFGFHIKRGLPKWERYGHPLDTLSVLACYWYLILVGLSKTTIWGYLALGVFSCILITKDEKVHQQECGAAEQWIHSLLFVVHAVVLVVCFLLWPSLSSSETAWISNPDILIPFFWINFIGIHLFLAYQIIFWIILNPTIGDPKTEPEINNALYHDLGEKWYTAQDDPVALLRQEKALITPWVKSIILSTHPRPTQDISVLDVGCGAGLLSNSLAETGMQVTGLDCSTQSLAVARQYDATKTVRYVDGDAYHLPFDDHTFDAVCALDFLEHVDDPGRAVSEMSRVLKSGGRFIFHTFNKTPVAWLLAIKGLEWFVKNTPRHLHVYSLFISPKQLTRLCTDHQLKITDTRGIKPVLNAAFWKLLRTGVVPTDFRFEWTSRTLVSYIVSGTKQ